MKCIYHNDMDGRCAGSLVAYFVDNYNSDDLWKSVPEKGTIFGVGYKM